MTDAPGSNESGGLQRRRSAIQNFAAANFRVALPEVGAEEVTFISTEKPTEAQMDQMMQDDPKGTLTRNKIERAWEAKQNRTQDAVARANIIAGARKLLLGEGLPLTTAVCGPRAAEFARFLSPNMISVLASASIYSSLFEMSGVIRAKYNMVELVRHLDLSIFKTLLDAQDTFTALSVSASASGGGEGTAVMSEIFAAMLASVFVYDLRASSKQDQATEVMSDLTTTTLGEGEGSSAGGSDTVQMAFRRQAVARLAEMVTHARNFTKILSKELLALRGPLEEGNSLAEFLTQVARKGEVVTRRLWIARNPARANQELYRLNMSRELDYLREQVNESEVRIIDPKQGMLDDLWERASEVGFSEEEVLSWQRKYQEIVKGSGGAGMARHIFYHLFYPLIFAMVTRVELPLLRDCLDQLRANEDFRRGNVSDAEKMRSKLGFLDAFYLNEEESVTATFDLVEETNRLRSLIAELDGEGEDTFSFWNADTADRIHEQLSLFYLTLKRVVATDEAAIEAWRAANPEKQLPGLNAGLLTRRALVGIVEEFDAKRSKRMQKMIPVIREEVEAMADLLENYAQNSEDARVLDLMVTTWVNAPKTFMETPVRYFLRRLNQYHNRGPVKRKQMADEDQEAVIFRARKKKNIVGDDEDIAPQEGKEGGSDDDDDSSGEEEEEQEEEENAKKNVGELRFLHNKLGRLVVPEDGNDREAQARNLIRLSSLADQLETFVTKEADARLEKTGENYTAIKVAILAVVSSLRMLIVKETGMSRAQWEATPINEAALAGSLDPARRASSLWEEAIGVEVSHLLKTISKFEQVMVHYDPDQNPARKRTPLGFTKKVLMTRDVARPLVKVPKDLATEVEKILRRRALWSPEIPFYYALSDFRGNKVSPEYVGLAHLIPVNTSNQLLALLDNISAKLGTKTAATLPAEINISLWPKLEALYDTAEKFTESIVKPERQAVEKVHAEVRETLKAPSKALVEKLTTVINGFLGKNRTRYPTTLADMVTKATEFREGMTEDLKTLATELLALWKTRNDGAGGDNQGPIPMETDEQAQNAYTLALAGWGIEYQQILRNETAAGETTEAPVVTENVLEASGQQKEGEEDVTMTETALTDEQLATRLVEVLVNACFSRDPTSVGVLTEVMSWLASESRRGIARPAVETRIRHLEGFTQEPYEAIGLALGTKITKATETMATEQAGNARITLNGLHQYYAAREQATSSSSSSSSSSFTRRPAPPLHLSGENAVYVLPMAAAGASRLYSRNMVDDKKSEADFFLNLIPTPSDRSDRDQAVTAVIAISYLALRGVPLTQWLVPLIPVPSYADKKHMKSIEMPLAFWWWLGDLSDTSANIKKEFSANFMARLDALIAHYAEHEGVLLMHVPLRALRHLFEIFLPTTTAPETHAAFVEQLKTVVARSTSSETPADRAVIYLCLLWGTYYLKDPLVIFDQVLAGSEAAVEAVRQDIVDLSVSYNAIFQGDDASYQQGLWFGRGIRFRRGRLDAGINEGAQVNKIRGVNRDLQIQAFLKSKADVWTDGVVPLRFMQPLLQYAASNWTRYAAVTGDKSKSLAEQLADMFLPEDDQRSATDLSSKLGLALGLDPSSLSRAMAAEKAELLVDRRLARHELAGRYPGKGELACVMRGLNIPNKNQAAAAADQETPAIDDQKLSVLDSLDVLLERHPLLCFREDRVERTMSAAEAALLSKIANLDDGAYHHNQTDFKNLLVQLLGARGEGLDAGKKPSKDDLISLATALPELRELDYHLYLKVVYGALKGAEGGPQRKGAAAAAAATESATAAEKRAKILKVATAFATLGQVAGEHLELIRGYYREHLLPSELKELGATTATASGTTPAIVVAKADTLLKLATIRLKGAAGEYAQGHSLSQLLGLHYGYQELVKAHTARLFDLFNGAGHATARLFLAKVSASGGGTAVNKDLRDSYRQVAEAFSRAKRGGRGLRRLAAAIEAPLLAIIRANDNLKGVATVLFNEAKKCLAARQKETTWRQKHKEAKDRLVEDDATLKQARAFIEQWQNRGGSGVAEGLEGEDEDDDLGGVEDLETGDDDEDEGVDRKKPASKAPFIPDTDDDNDVSETPLARLRTRPAPRPTFGGAKVHRMTEEEEENGGGDRPILDQEMEVTEEVGGTSTRGHDAGEFQPPTPIKITDEDMLLAWKPHHPLVAEVLDQMMLDFITGQTSRPLPSEEEI